MVRKQYNIVFYGEIVEGYCVEDVRQHLASQFSLDPETCEQLFAGKAVVIREYEDYMAASTLQTNCELQGAICHLELAQVNTQYNAIDVSKLCNIEFCGKTLPGHRVEDVKNNLGRLLKANRQTIEQLFCGKQIVIKKDMDYQTALNIEAGFEQAGAICRITASDKNLPQNKALQSEIFLPTNLEMMICPKCGARQKATSTCEKCGIVVARFVKRQRRPIRCKAPQKTSKRKALTKEALLPEYEDEEDEVVFEEEKPVEVHIGRKTIPIWQIWLLGNAIFTLLITLFGISLYDIMVPFSLDPEFYDHTIEFKNILALLVSNAQIAGLIGPPVPLLVYFRRTLYKMDRPALRYRFWAALLTVIGATLMIDVFVFMRSGVAFVGSFTLKAFALSAIAYLIGFGIFLAIKRKELLTSPETEETEVFEDEEAEAFDEEEMDSVESDETISNNPITR